MVKVLIDGKEYEGKKVEIHNYDMFDGDELYHYFKDKEESPSQKFRRIMSEPNYVSVPKEIQFIKRDYNPIGILKKNLMLKIGTHYLKGLWDSEYPNLKGDWAFISTLSYHPELEEHIVDCVLVPIKREDLKAGDWAFRWDSDCEKIDTTYEEGYMLILENHKMVKATIDTLKSVHVLEWESENDDSYNWFKVVPKSEVDK